ncbi:MAG: cytochrome-c peroxidase [Deltaproteobacteria bacterium]|nr:cytochrome-c peroxidase [Deltaproteobacteria bacterium]
MLPAAGLLLATLLVALPAGAGALRPLPPPPVPEGNPQTVEKIELGKKLFFDRRLSGDGTMSCASCHVPDQAYTDGQEISLSYPTTRNWRNAPTLINAAYFQSLFHDGRAATLEEQALFPVMSSFEMNLNLDFLEEKLRIVPEYAAAFKKIFGGEVTRARIAMAIAAFERTLVSVNAPIDRYLAGDDAALSPEARRGYGIFTGKGKCADCHFGPHLSDDRFHALNVPENPEYRKDPRITATRRFVAKVFGYDDYRNLEEDPGRYLVTKDRKDWKAFRTPTLREISRTAPYMHNGILKTLEEVIEFLDRGGGPGNKALSPLGLSDGEKRALKAFLVEALSGDEVRLKVPAIP